MKYNTVKIMLVANSLVIAAAFVYFAIEYSNWDVTIVFFLLFIYAIMIIIIYNLIESEQIKEMNDLRKLAEQLALMKKQAKMLLEKQSERMVVSEPHYTIDNKTENDKKRASNSYPSLGHIGEDEHDELTECERNYKKYLNNVPSEN